MRRLRDLQCPSCKTVYADILADDDHTCACGVRTTTYFGGSHLARNAETPIVFGGVTYSPSEFATFRGEWKKVHHEELNVVGDDHKARKQRLEESHHATIQACKQQGMERMVRDIESAGARIR